jgi:hypothetical protein
MSFIAGGKSLASKSSEKSKSAGAGFLPLDCDAGTKELQLCWLQAEGVKSRGEGRQSAKFHRYPQ